MLRNIIEDLTMSSVLSERQYQTYRDFKFWSGIILSAVFIIVILIMASWNDDTMVRPKIEKEFTKNNYIVEVEKKNSINRLKCISKETGGYVTVGFHNNGGISDIGYAYPVEDAYMKDKNISEFKKHIDETFKIVAKHKKKIKESQNYPAYPISDEFFEAYSKNVKKKSQITNDIDGYDFVYEYLGNEGDNAIFYYYTEIKD